MKDAIFFFKEKNCQEFRLVNQKLEYIAQDSVYALNNPLRIFMPVVQQVYMTGNI